MPTANSSRLMNVSCLFWLRSLKINGKGNEWEEFDGWQFFDEMLKRSFYPNAGIISVLLKI